MVFDAVFHCFLVLHVFMIQNKRSLRRFATICNHHHMSTVLVAARRIVMIMCVASRDHFDRSCICWNHSFPTSCVLRTKRPDQTGKRTDGASMAAGTWLRCANKHARPEGS